MNKETLPFFELFLGHFFADFMDLHACFYRAKQAWLRLGLYHRKKGQFNDAIHWYNTFTC